MSVKPGDIVRDPGLVPTCALVRFASWEDSQTPIPYEPGRLAEHDIRTVGVRIIALPAPSEVEVPVGSRWLDGRGTVSVVRAVDDEWVSYTCISGMGKGSSGSVRAWLWGSFSTRIPDEPVAASVTPIPHVKVPRCAPGCTPAKPCMTEAVCPVFAEERMALGRRCSTPAAHRRRYSRPEPMRSGLGGMACGMWRVGGP